MTSTFKNKWLIRLYSLYNDMSKIGIHRVILSLILISSIIVAIYFTITPKSGEIFTEFYLLDPSGMASDYPTELKLGDYGELIVGLVNHEFENTTYRIAVNFNDHQIYDYHVFVIDTEVWESPFTFQATEKGENQKLEFLLYKDQEVYRTLHLWINVQDT